MGKNLNNAHAYGDINNAVYTSKLGVTLPVDPTSAYPAGWYEVGWLDDTGLIEAQTQKETKKYGWQGGALVRVLRNQSEHTFAFNCLEENAVVMGLLRPNSTISSTGSSSEVQKIVFTGTATAGTFTLSVPGYGTTTAIQYNATVASIGTALSTVVGGTVTATGTLDTTGVVVTFPASLGLVSLMTVANSVTGWTAITVTETTPGVAGINTSGVKPYTGRNLRQFGIDVIDDPITHRYLSLNGEVTSTGGKITYKSDDLTIWQFTLNCYLDEDGDFFKDINNNPALASGLFE